MTVPYVSIVLPCRNEEACLAACLDSIIETDYPSDRLEILVVDGRSTDRTRDILARYTAEHASIVLLDNPSQHTAAAMNLGVRTAAGEIIVRMDAHAEYPPDYIRRLVIALEETGADNVGAVLVTLPEDDTPVARAIAIGLSHRFGVGNSHFRVGARARRAVDTVPFGCYRRAVFQRIGLFDEELIRNQDDEFNFRLITHGGRILLLPDVVCYYRARRSLRQVARMYYQYGYFKPLVARKVHSVVTARQLVPPLFVAGLAGTALLVPWVPAAGALLLALTGTYGAATLACAAQAAWAAGPRCGLALAAVFPVLHVSYGAGFLRGIVDHFVRRRAPAASAVTLSR